MTPDTRAYLTLRWMFVALYAIVALVAAWGGIAQLNPPAAEATAFNPDPLPLVVNSAMLTTALFYLVTAAAFANVAFYAVREAQAPVPGGIARTLNAAFSAFIAIVALYLVWYGSALLLLGGSPAYLLTGIVLLISAGLLLLRKPAAAYVYAGVVAAWIAISLLESGLDFLALLPRLAAFLVVGLWFLTPWHRAAMGKSPERRIDAGGRWVGGTLAAGGGLLAVGAFQTYPVDQGTNNGVSGAGTSDWRHYGGDAGGQRFAQLDQINVSNVGKLEKAWEYRTGVGYDFKQTPQMANGLVYICTAGNTLIAVDADTGEEVWRTDTNTVVPGGLEKASTFARTCRGVGYHEAAASYAGECAKRIITGTVDARLFAVDAMTGRRCQSFGFDGEVSLVSGLGYSPLGNYMVTSAPLVAGDKVVVGGWVTDNQQLGNPSGVLRAYDAVTGQFAWAWDMGNPGYNGLPDEGGEYTRGTPNIWSHTSYDPDLNLIYAPTGNSSPDYFDGGLRSKEAEENSAAIVAIDAATGQRRWVYQTVHRDIWDYDVPSQPTLVNVRKNGQGELIPAVVQPTKRGEIFLLDRRTGVPIYDTQEIAVPQNPEVGEATAATQPFSPLPHFREDRTEKDMWGLTPLDMLHCRIEFKKMRYEGHFTPPMRGGGGYGQAKDTWGGTFQYPGNAGGFNWGSISVDPDNGLLIGAPMLMGNRVTLKSLADHQAEREEGAARRSQLPVADEHAAPVAPSPRQRSPEAIAHAERFDQSQVAYVADTQPFMSTWRLPLPFLNVGTELPCFEPPFSQMAVIDLNANKLLWKRPVGSMKESGPFGIPTGLPFMVGTPVQAGVLTTRGGLIFHGGAMDSTMRAFDLRTGEVKWESPMPGSAHATPMSYLGKTGKQYIVVTLPNPSWRYPRAPSSTLPEDDQGGRVIAYALPEST